jgi:sortase A
MVSGVLLLLDAGATVAWQEPVSALLAQRERDVLDARLERRREELARVVRRLPPAERRGRPRLRALARRFERRTEVGDPVGRISLPTLRRSYPVVEGTDAGSLRKAPGHYPGTPLPGQPGTAAIAGHRTTYGAPFRTVDRLGRGDRVEVTTPYGRFTYEVEGTRIVPPTALWVTRRVDHDRLVLSACHPLYSAAQRIVVFARLTRARPA